MLNHVTKNSLGTLLKTARSLGNLTPPTPTKVPDFFCFQWFSEVLDAVIHMQMLGGPTHRPSPRKHHVPKGGTPDKLAGHGADHRL